MGHDLGSHAHSNPFGTAHEEGGDFGRKTKRFFVTAIITIYKVGCLGIEHHLKRKRCESTFDISRGGCVISSENITKVPLFVDEVFFVGDIDFSSNAFTNSDIYC